MAEPSLIEPKLNFSTAFAQILDKRILKALSEMGFSRPTLIQAQAIPIALEGKDILARARTGSGKTAAYCIPVVQKILQAKAGVDPPILSSRALILVPTKELAEQVTAYLRKLLIYCDKAVKSVNIASGASRQMEKLLLADVPDVIVGTPSRVLALLQSKTIALSGLETLVIDEADLILSYGHDIDVRNLLSGDHFPKVYQSLLMSATMTQDVQTLKGLILRSPAILKLEETEDEAANLSQYFVRCNELDKFLLIYVILKLKLVQGKCILFVNDVDRFHIVQEFNKGVYDYILASDEGATRGEVDSEDGTDGDEENNDDDSDGNHEEPVTDSGLKEPVDLELDKGPSASSLRTPSKISKKRKQSPVDASSALTAKRAKKDGRSETDTVTSQVASSKKSRKTAPTDKEFGVSRGVDFVDVACVINFDLPSSARGYTHRVGRTARAGRTGLAISFVVPAEAWGKSKVVSLPSAKGDEKVFNRIQKEQGARGSTIKEYDFDMQQVEAFRYRMEDALRAVTRAAVKEARVVELKSEVLNSDKLKAHFEDHPLDLDYLRHDKPLRPTRIQSHMKHVPKYLVPRIAPVDGDGAPTSTAGKLDAGTKDVGFVPFRKDSGRGRGARGRSGRGGGRGGRGGSGPRRKDPLRKFGAK